MFNLRTQSKIYLRETIKFWLKTIVALKPIFGKILLHKDWLFFCPHINAKTSTLRILFIFQWSVKLQLSDRGWVLKFQLEGDKVQWLQTLCGRTLIFLGKSLYKDIYIFFVHSGAPDLIYPGTSLYEHILWMHLEKSGLTHAHFLNNSRKLVNVVQVRFTMMYSSRKLNNKKVITTACNFWRQIACSFQVYGLSQFDSKNSVLNFALFFTWPTLTSQAVLSDNFSDRSTKIRAQKQQFLIANMSEILASIELKLHSVFIWFTLNTFH